MDSEPTLGELARSIKALTEQVAQLVARLDRDRVEFRAEYLPREVWSAVHKADAAIIADLSADIRVNHENSKAEIVRIEGKHDRFTDKYEETRKGDSTRKLQVTMFVVGLVVAQFVSIVLGVLALRQ